MSTNLEHSALSYFKRKEARNFDSPENESTTLERHVHDENGEMWDNRCTLHYAVHDYGEAPRVMHRTTVAGGIPWGMPPLGGSRKKGDQKEP
jgi:hypothetical protein